MCECAVAQTASFVCGGDGAATAEAVTSATATAYALATAQASGECVLKGDGSGYFSAVARSFISADAWIEAYAEAVSFAASCTACEAFAESWAYVAKNVILEAHAQAAVSVRSTATTIRHVAFLVFRVVPECYVRSAP